MRYCAFLGDIEWYEDNLSRDVENAAMAIAQQYGEVTFLTAPMCVYNLRVSNIPKKVKKSFPDAHFVLCTKEYHSEYITPGAPFDSILIPAEINRIEDYYPYLCKWIIEKSDTVLIYISRNSLDGKNNLSIDACKLKEYAKSLSKEVFIISPEAN